MKSKDKKLIWIVIIVTIILLLITLILYLNYANPTSKGYFFDKKLGWVSTQVKILGWFNSFLSFFQQTALFSKTTANVNENLQINDQHLIVVNSLTNIASTYPTYKCYIGYVDFVIIKPDGTTATVTQTLAIPGYEGQNIGTSIGFSPVNVGTYGIKTIYYEKKCDLVGNNCSSNSICPKTFTDESTSTLTVTAVNTQCSTQTRYDPDWTDDSNTIDNGKRQYRTHIVVGSYPSCTETNTDEHKTVCNAGYHVSGSSTGTTIGTGELTCESDTITTTDCTSTGCTAPQVCNPNTKVCQDSQCSANETCTNSTIVLSICNNGILTSTGNTCSGTNSTNNSTNQNNNQSNTGQGTNQTCWVVEGATTQISFDLSTKCKTYTFITDTPGCDKTKGFYATEAECKSANSNDYLIYIIVGATILIIFGIAIFLFLRNKNGRHK